MESNAIARTFAFKVSTVVLAAGLLTACQFGNSGPQESHTHTRSAAAVCSVVKKHRQQFLSSMNKTNSTNGLTNLIRTARALGDLSLMWDDIAEVAPANIHSDAEAVSKAWKTAESGDIRSPSTWASALFNSGSITRVNNYIAKHCGSEYAPVSAPRSSASSPATSKVIFDKTFADSEGYRYRVVLNGPANYTPHIDIANAKPGMAIFGFAYSVSGTVYNMTPGRNAVIPDGSAVAVVWKNGTSQCKDLGESDNFETSGFCGRVWQINATEASIPAGGKVSFTSTPGLILPLSVNEHDAKATSTDFGRPGGWVFMTGMSGLASAPSHCLSDVAIEC